MGIFDGILLISDFDNTLVYTEPALQTGAPIPPMSPRNREAIERFMAEGGLFTMATGRALTAFRAHAAGIPMNAPAVVNNGAGIYDFARGEYLRTTLLPPESMAELAEIAAPFPTVASEIYHLDDLMETVRPNQWTEAHAQLTGVHGREIPSLTATGGPVTKVLFMEELPLLLRLRDALAERGGGERYELVFSSDHLLEITRKGANKGTMVRILAEMVGVDPRLLCCVGDHANDLPMLRAAGRAFAPENAIPQVLADPLVTAVGHCQDGAVADVIGLLEQLRG